MRGIVLAQIMTLLFVSSCSLTKSQLRLVRDSSTTSSQLAEATIEQLYKMREDTRSR